ncbi:hypothetical protein A3Q56_04111 [Intoshia linei]|uniref:DJ-1/PfpI domain-containing protein n=1 Tax=Intoshia linei TaxID=1819745 RepID=A0A177B125_9BILA|nr:hypothetical protein A3Q56_04111 [Intoshia linei]
MTYLSLLSILPSSLFKTFLTIHKEAFKKIGAICAGPLVLKEFDLFKNSKITCYPSLSDKFKKDYLYEDEAVVVCGNYITGRSPGCAMEFALRFVKEICNQEDEMNQVMKEVAIV